MKNKRFPGTLFGQPLLSRRRFYLIKAALAVWALGSAAGAVVVLLYWKASPLIRLPLGFVLLFLTQFSTGVFDSYRGYEEKWKRDNLLSEGDSESGVTG